MTAGVMELFPGRSLKASPMDADGMYTLSGDLRTDLATGQGEATNLRALAVGACGVQCMRGFGSGCGV